MNDLHTLAPFALGIVVLMIVLIIAWIVLPFAIIGTKPILRELLAELKESNRHARALQDRMTPPQRPLYEERSK